MPSLVAFFARAIFGVHLWLFAWKTMEVIQVFVELHPVMFRLFEHGDGRSFEGRVGE